MHLKVLVLNKWKKSPRFNNRKDFAENSYDDSEEQINTKLTDSTEEKAKKNCR